MIAALGPFEQLVAFLAAPVRGLDPRLALLALALHAGNLACRAVAWRGILAAAYPDRRVPLVGVGAAYAAGVALNGVLPARGGEAAKVALVRLQLPGSSVVSISTSGSLVLLFDALLGTALLGVAWHAGALPSAPVAVPLDAVRAHPVVVPGILAAAALAAWIAGRRLRRVLARVREDVRRGATVLRTPGRYAATVLVPQAGAWLCRIGTVLALLAAYGLPASLSLAALVVVLGGVSTLVPATPGGAGTQQLFVVYGLHGAVSTASALSFSIGMQVGVTAVNALIGAAAAMLLLRTLHPVAAIRGCVRDARA